MHFSKHLLSLCTLIPLLITPAFATAAPDNAAGIKIEKLLESDKSWDGTLYQAYPSGTPELTVLKISIAPHSSLAWHEHPIPNAAYILQGALTVEKRSTGEKRVLKAGEVLPEMVNSAHRGYTGKEGAILVVFYAGKKGTPLSIPAR